MRQYRARADVSSVKKWRNNAGLIPPRQRAMAVEEVDDLQGRAAHRRRVICPVVSRPPPAAYTLPCRRFVPSLAAGNARLGADAGC